MKYTLFIVEEQVKFLEYEVLSQDYYILLTRYLFDKIDSPCHSREYITSEKNRLINLSRTIKGGKIYRLEADMDGLYHDAEHSWHDSQFFLILRGLNTIQFIEFAIHLVKKRYWNIDFLNKNLLKENVSFFFKCNNHEDVLVEIDSIVKTEEEKENPPSIRLLVLRMDCAFDNEDYSNLLHASACIFETMAKDIINIESIDNQTLKSFFERYKKDSGLPNEFLDYILMIYERRCSTPLAAHGNTKMPNISKQEAIIIIEMTKAFVKIQYKFNREKVIL